MGAKTRNIDISASCTKPFNYSLIKAAHCDQ